MLLRFVILDENGTVMWPPISFFLVALRRAVLPAATWSFRNASAKMRNQLVGPRNGLGKSLALFQKKIYSMQWHSQAFIIFYEYFSVFYLILMHFSVPCSYGKSFWSFVYVIIYYVGAGISTLISFSGRLDPYIFLSKDGKDVVYERRNGQKGVYFPPESAFFLCK